MSYAESLSRRVRDALHHSPNARSQSDLWMSLAEAAAALHEAQRGSDLDRISWGLSESEGVLQAFWARRVAEAGVPVYGMRIMGSQPERIPVEIMRTGKLIDGATRLDMGLGQPLQDFCALRVRKVEFERCLADSRQHIAS